MYPLVFLERMGALLNVPSPKEPSTTAPHSNCIALIRFLCDFRSHTPLGAINPIFDP